MAAKIPKLSSAVDFRNLLANVYHCVKGEVVWDAAKSDLPELRLTVQAPLAELEWSLENEESIVETAES